MYILRALIHIHADRQHAEQRKGTAGGANALSSEKRPCFAAVSIVEALHGGSVLDSGRAAGSR